MTAMLKEKESKNEEEPKQHLLEQIEEVKSNGEMSEGEKEKHEVADDFWTGMESSGSIDERQMERSNSKGIWNSENGKSVEEYFLEDNTKKALEEIQMDI
eukprot:scaffold5115_cov62-Cylindrotheca_fusiformis.AAC.1